MKPPNMLMVDDDVEFLDIFLRAAKVEGRLNEYTIMTAKNASDAIEIIRDNSIDVVVTDIMMPGQMDGYALFKTIKERYENLPVILMTAYGTVEKAVKAVKEGAYHYFEKPIRYQYMEFWKTVEGAVRQKRLREAIQDRLKKNEVSSPIVGTSQAIKKAIESITKVAPMPVSVLIVGETGTGKEMAARAIHELSGDETSPFVAINSAVLTGNLLESELFGHSKGSFTGAEKNRPGVFERADGGTLFMDEISEMSLQAQAEILRVIDTQTFIRVGGKKERTTNFRLICATNKDLKKQVEKGEFRQDLFFRLNVYPVKMPSLTDRKEDLPLLVAHFLSEFAEKFSLPVKQISNEALIFMHQYDWPGNVRELKNLVERGMVSAQDDTIGLKDLFPNQKQTSSFEPVTSIKEMEILMIKLALEKCDQNKTVAARNLGIGLKTLYEKMKRYGLN